MASVTVNLTGGTFNSEFIGWIDEISIGSVFDQNGQEQTLSSVALFDNGVLIGNVQLSLLGAGDDFTTEFEATGRVIFENNDGETLEVQIANADTDEPYIWRPSNSSEVIQFVNHIRDASNVSVTLTLTDDPPTVAPSFTDDTGDAQSWIQNTAITPITVPAAVGTPTPTYSAIGALPAGISFNTTTRVISGTPTATGSGTIRIRATNSEGTDDWTVAYTINAPDTVPSLPSVDSQEDLEDIAISTLTLPAATGGNTPLTYEVSGLPTGLAFASSTRQATGTPTTPGTFSVTYTVTDNDGDTDEQEFTWTILEDTTPSLPSAGPYTRSGAGNITRTLPAGSGGNSPLSYRATESDADGSILSFNSSNRQIIVNIPNAPATLTITYTVTDNDGDSHSINVEFKTVVTFVVPSAPALPTLIPAINSLIVEWASPLPLVATRSRATISSIDRVLVVPSLLLTRRGTAENSDIPS